MVLRLPLLWTPAYMDVRVQLRARLVCSEHPRPWPGGATPCGDTPPYTAACPSPVQEGAEPLELELKR